MSKHKIVPVVVDSSSSHKHLDLATLTPERREEMIAELNSIIAKFSNEPAVQQAAQIAIQNLKKSAGQ